MPPAQADLVMRSVGQDAAWQTSNVVGHPLAAQQGYARIEADPVQQVGGAI